MGRVAAATLLDARDLRRDDRHVRARQERVPTAGDVRCDRLHGHVLLPEEHAGQGLDLEVGEGGELVARHGAHLLLHEPDVLDHLVGHARHDLGDLSLG